jgi:hypothetical protein
MVVGVFLAVAAHGAQEYMSGAGIFCSQVFGHGQIIISYYIGARVIVVAEPQVRGSAYPRALERTFVAHEWRLATPPVCWFPLLFASSSPNSMVSPLSAWQTPSVFPFPVEERPSP